MKSTPFETPPFPTDLFPGDIRNFIKEASRSLSCPQDFIGVFALSVLSSAIGSSRAIEVKPDWIEPAVIYSGIIAPPSSKKSPAFKIALGPVIEYQQKMKSDYDLLKKKYEKEMLLWESDKTNISKPKKPTLRRNYINDFTFEALSRILQDNTKGVLLGIDELVGWIASMDAYRKKGGDKEKWLSMWTCSPLVADRSSMDDPIMISNPFVSVTGGIQPERIQLLKSKEEDGFLARVLVSFPERMRDKWIDEPIPRQVILNYKKRYEELYKLEPESFDGNRIKPVALKFSPQAKDAFIQFFNYNNDEIETEPNPQLRAAFKKIEAYTARFALILQLANSTESMVIDKEAVEYAVILAEYFKAHARKAYAYIRNVSLDNKIFKAIEFIKSYAGKITIRDFYTNKVAGCKNRNEAMSLFEKLEKSGIGKIESIQPKSGGKPTIYFTLHNYKCSS